MSATDKKVPSAKQPWWLKLLFGLFVLAVFFGASEATLRLLDVNLYQKNQFFPANRDIDFPEVYQRDPKLFWRFRPDREIDSRQFSFLSYQVNRFGMRGHDFDLNKRGFRIVALGNSCTFGWGVAEEETWVRKLEKLLNERHPETGFEIINAGVPGYSSHQGKIYFAEELVKLEPDMALIMFGWNDQWTAGRGIADVDQKTPGRLILRFQNTLSSLKLYQFLRKGILSATEESTAIPITETGGVRRVAPQDFLNNLREIVRTARSHQIEPVLLAPPVASLEMYFPGMVSPFHQRHKQYQELVATAGRYEQVPVVDLQLPFDQQAGLYDNPGDDPIHFNSHGHNVAAEAIAARLSELLMSR